MRADTRLPTSSVLLLACLLTLAACSAKESVAPPPPPKPVATIEILGAANGVIVDDSVTLTAVLKDADGVTLSNRQVAWSTDSAGASKAKLFANGVVEGTGYGDAQITASSEGKSVTVPLRVRLRFTEVSAGYTHACALTAKGTAWCWGSGASGQLGTPLAESEVPVRVGAQIRFRGVISSGGSHTCAIAMSGSTWCWGRGRDGQLGTGTAAASTVPVMVVGGHSFTVLTTGSNHTCGLVQNGAAYCWGWNAGAEVTGSTGPSRFEPFAVPAPPGVAFPLSFTAIAAGTLHTCAAATDADGGDVWCWGSNALGQHGNPPSSLRGFTQVSGLARVTQLSAGQAHTCAAGFDPANLQRKNLCWGLNSSAQLAHTLGTAYRNGTGVESGVSFASGVEHGCLLTATGSAQCWGGNTDGQLGRGSVFPQSAAPANVVSSGGFSKLSAGSSSTYGLSGGILYAWGANFFGQLGIGSKTSRSTPTAVVGQF